LIICSKSRSQPVHKKARPTKRRYGVVSAQAGSSSQDKVREELDTSLESANGNSSNSSNLLPHGLHFFHARSGQHYRVGNRDTSSNPTEEENGMTMHAKETSIRVLNDNIRIVTSIPKGTVCIIKAPNLMQKGNQFVTKTELRLNDPEEPEEHKITIQLYDKSPQYRIPLDQVRISQATMDNLVKSKAAFSKVWPWLIALYLICKSLTYYFLFI